jgi:hypothetical protein
MAKRIAPVWFTRKLRSINRHFVARWHDDKGLWSIDENVRWSTFSGFHDGAAVYRLRRRPARGIYVRELGHEALQLVRRQDPRRFKSMADVIKGLNIDGVPA